MKDLDSIIKKYSKVEYNQDNYSVGGGLTNEKFASNRHEDAKNDKGKLTFGKTCQMFKKATGSDLEHIKEVIKNAVPNMEWHHAGKLPKNYGGGMKKTYFLNAQEIIDIAEKWELWEKRLEVRKTEERKKAEEQRRKEQIKQEFLSKNAERVVRVSEQPEFFYETEREMNGKYGWFSSYGKSYNMPEYYTGWKFNDEERLNQFYKL